MAVRNLIVGVVLATGFGAGAQLAAQVFSPPTPVPPKVIAGPDVGFRIEGIDHDNTPVGQVVVKVKGEWVEARIVSKGGVKQAQ